MLIVLCCCNVSFQKLHKNKCTKTLKVRINGYKQSTIRFLIVQLIHFPLSMEIFKMLCIVNQMLLVVQLCDRDILKLWCLLAWDKCICSLSWLSLKCQAFSALFPHTAKMCNTMEIRKYSSFSWESTSYQYRHCENFVLTMKVMLCYLWTFCHFWLQINVLNLSSWRESCIPCVILSAGPASVWTCVMAEPIIWSNCCIAVINEEKKTLCLDLVVGIFFFFIIFLAINLKSTNSLFGNSLQMFFFRFSGSTWFSF